MPKFARRSYGRPKSRKPWGKLKHNARRTYKKKLSRKGRKSSSLSKMSFALQMAKQLPDQVYLFNNTDYVTVAGTTNSKATQIMWCQQADVSDVTNSIAGPLINLMPHDLNIVQQILAQQPASIQSNTGTVGSLINNPTAQVLIKSWQTSMSIRNLETGPISFTHYRCKARRDFGPTDSVVSGPQGVLQNGFADASVSTTTLPTGVTNPLLYTTLGATPFMNPRFVATVKVVKVKKYELRPGARINLKYTLARPRLWKNEDFNFGQPPDADGSGLPPRSILKGQMFSVFVMHGTFATNSSATAGYTKGVGNAAVGIVQMHKVHYATITPQVMQTSGINAIAGFTIGQCGYPQPVIANYPYSAVSTGPVPAAAGTVSFANIGSTIAPDVRQIS